MPKRCANCKQLLDPSAFNKDVAKKDGLCSWCRECKSLLSERTWRHGPRKKRTANVITYQVVYDPCDSFSVSSEFTRKEIYAMLNEDYLAIGTRFKRGQTEYEVGCYKRGALKLVRV